MVRWLLVALLLVSAASPAWAQERDETVDASEQARAQYQRGAQLANGGHWAEALEAFRRADASWPRAIISYNIGVCERELGHTARAYAAFRQALDRDPDETELTPRERKLTRDHLRDLDRQLAHIVITIEPSEALITVDGRPLEQLPSRGAPQLLAGTRAKGGGEPTGARRFLMLAEPGRHQITLHHQGRRHSHALSLRAGDNLEQSARMPAESPEPTTVTPSPPPEQSPLPAQATTLGVRPVAGIAMCAAAVVGGAVAVGLTVEANNTWDDARAACPGESDCPDDTGPQLSRDARAYANYATVAAVVSGAALLGGGVLLWTGLAAEDEEHVSWWLTPSGVVLRARY